MGQVSNTFMVVFLWLGNLKWNFKKIFFINISKCQWTQLRPLPSWNLCTKSFLKYFFLANLVIKSLLYLCLIIILFGYLVCLPKTNFRKVEFNCKVQLSRWPLLSSVPMCGFLLILDPVDFRSQLLALSKIRISAVVCWLRVY